MSFPERAIAHFVWILFRHPGPQEPLSSILLKVICAQVQKGKNIPLTGNQMWWQKSLRPTA